jgi:hypothetical protein
MTLMGRSLVAVQWSQSAESSQRRLRPCNAQDAVANLAQCQSDGTRKAAAP